MLLNIGIVSVGENEPFLYFLFPSAVWYKYDENENWRGRKDFISPITVHNTSKTTWIVNHQQNYMKPVTTSLSNILSWMFTTFPGWCNFNLQLRSVKSNQKQYLTARKMSDLENKTIVLVNNENLLKLNLLEIIMDHTLATCTYHHIYTYYLKRVVLILYVT